MSDDRELRELERTWRASEAPADRTAWLVALQRRGRFRPRGLEVAAACGDRVARELLAASGAGELVGRGEVAALAGVSALEGASGKLAWRGVVRAVRPRISLKMVLGEPKHAYLGYVLVLDGDVAGTPGRFAVGLGDAAQQKSALQAGDTVEGAGVPVARGAAEVADLYKASGLVVVSRGPRAPVDGPPWLGPPPALETYRANGSVLFPDAPAVECATCIWFCDMPMGDVSPQPVCYGPQACPRRP